MIIRHMQGTFGTLDGEQLRLDTGLNIIYAPNESGKSTWCAFLRLVGIISTVSKPLRYALRREYVCARGTRGLRSLRCDRILTVS